MKKRTRTAYDDDDHVLLVCYLVCRSHHTQRQNHTLLPLNACTYIIPIKMHNIRYVLSLLKLASAVFAFTFILAHSIYCFEVLCRSWYLYPLSPLICLLLADTFAMMKIHECSIHMGWNHCPNSNWNYLLCVVLLSPDLICSLAPSFHLNVLYYIPRAFIYQNKKLNRILNAKFYVWFLWLSRIHCSYCSSQLICIILHLIFHSFIYSELIE